MSLSAFRNAPSDRLVAVSLLLGLASAIPSSQPASQASAPSLEPVAQWGCDACTGPELFGAVQEIAVTTGGAVFALDSYAPVVRRFAAGAQPAGFGAKGQGPGEFRSGTAIAVVADGVIEVIDALQRRMTRLDFDGNELSTRPLTQFPIATGYAPALGAWYLSIIDFHTFTSAIKRLDDGAEEPAQIRSVDWPLDDEGKPNDYFALIARPSGGFAVGDGNIEYRIRLFDATGGPEADIVRDIARLAKTDEELRIERERRDAGMARRAQMAAAEGGSAAALGQPPIDPMKRFFYMNALDYDGRGRLWVLTGRGGVDFAVFDVFGADNAYLGEVEVPVDVTRFDIAGEWLATTGMSDAEFPVVHLWRIVHAP